MEAQFREVATGLRFPEGPVALPDGPILCVEMAAGALTAVVDGQSRVIAEVGGGPNGAAIGPDGKCYVCNNGGLSFTVESGFRRPIGGAPGHPDGWIDRVDLGTGAVERLYTHCEGRPLHGPNDIVFDSNGGFWFTDLGGVHDRSIIRGSVYYARADGSLIREAVFPIFMPNGVGLSSDGLTLYVSETDTSRLWSYPIVGEGQVQKQPWPSPNGGRIVYGGGGYQRFDSLALEAGGNICVATLVNGGISVISPAGELVEFWRAPEPYCTNICFGGPDLRTAFITLSGTGRIVAVDWPRPGLKLNSYEKGKLTWNRSQAG
jgi:gluconolactonase